MHWLTLSTKIFWIEQSKCYLLVKYEQFPQTRRKWSRHFWFGFSKIYFAIFTHFEDSTVVFVLISFDVYFLQFSHLRSVAASSSVTHVTHSQSWAKQQQQYWAYACFSRHQLPNIRKKQSKTNVKMANHSPKWTFRKLCLPFSPRPWKSFKLYQDIAFGLVYSKKDRGCWQWIQPSEILPYYSYSVLYAPATKRAISF